MTFTSVILEKRKSVATITLNRPEALNSLTREMWLEIEEAIRDVEMDDTIRVVVITGKGRAFCAGADLKQVKERVEHPLKMLEYFQLVHRVLNRIENLGKPVIAAVNGLALAGGFEIILACDIVIASKEARIGDQHARYALVPGGGGTQRAPRIMGIRKAKELLLTGDWLSAEEAERVGLVNRVVPADELDKAVDEMTAKLVDKSPLGSATIKNLVNRGMDTDLNTALNLEIGSIFPLMGTEDFSEGLRAFTEKRKPVYKGK